jgi:purine-binding chemotaxis protein CheW
MTRAAPLAIIAFELNERRYGLRLADVREVLALPTIFPLPMAPTIVEGVVNIRGVVPVMDIRTRFRLSAKAPHPSDHLLVAWAGPRLVALRVDRVLGLESIDPRDMVEAEAITPRADYLVGVARQCDGLVLLHDLGTFLADAEASDLDEALGAAASVAVPSIAA